MIMNKRGLLLRDLVFMTVIFGIVMTLATFAALDMAAEYENLNMTAEYTADGVSSLGGTVTDGIVDDVDSMREATEPTNESSGGLIGAFATLGVGVVDGAATVIRVVFTAPIIAGNALFVVMNSVGIPTDVSKPVGIVVTTLIYILIIFAIISALLKGGKI